MVRITAGLARSGLDLGESHDPQIDRAIEGLRVAGIGEFQQAFARRDPLRIRRKDLEQTEFGRRQGMLIAFVVAQRLRFEIKPFGAEPDQMIVGRLSPRPLLSRPRRLAGPLRRSTERIRAINSRSSQGLAM